MDTPFQPLLDWVAAHAAWAYLILFLAALTESLAVVGMLIPGVLILLAAGALIAAGVLDLWLAWLVATIGAILGDTLSFWIGRRFKTRIRGLWPFSRYPGSLEHGERFFARFGVWSIVLGRFVGPVRAIVPLIAGMMAMRAGHFLTANVLSAMAWAPAYLLPGILFGASLKLAAEAAGRLVILALLLVALLSFSAWFSRRLFLFLSPRAGALVSRLLRWGNLHPNMGKVALALADPQHPDAAILAALAGLLIIATLLVGAMAGVTFVGPAELTLNQTVLDLGLSLHTPPANDLMAVLGRLGDPVVMLTLVVAVYLYLRHRRHRRHARYWLAAAGFALAAAPILGHLLRVARPDIGLGDLGPWSFPSVPVLGATVVYGFLAVALARGIPPTWRWIPYVTATSLVTAIVTSRLYFGAEWLSDLIGSVALGLAWVAILGLAFRRHSRFDRRWPGLASIACATLAAAVTVRTLTSHSDDLARLAPAPIPITVTETAWYQQHRYELPRQRLDLWQRHRQPLNLQYAGPPAALTDRLTEVGWRPAELLQWRNALRLLSPTLPLTDLPVIPHVHDGQHEALVLVHDLETAERRFVLRLWSSQYVIDEIGPVWIGHVTSQHKEVLLGLFALPTTDEDATAAWHRLNADLEGLRRKPADLDRTSPPIWLLEPE
ncbi:VTT domain-containing protein [Thioalkalicoccus limnaeus]|uniref:VTT domain-containing protein n=1 Tax=Thioalkalicoccus limnaeus TaxID=120681 RepID=A0ABV4BK20_9GAMM